MVRGGDRRIPEDRIERQGRSGRSDGRGGPEFHPVSERRRSDAIATYLKDMPRIRTSAKTAPADRQRGHGSRKSALCRQLHRMPLENGDGIAQVFPPLKASSPVRPRTRHGAAGHHRRGDVVATKDKPTGLRCRRSAGSSPIRRSPTSNYIRNAWGNHASPTSAGTVSKVRKNSNMVAADLLKCAIHSTDGELTSCRELSTASRLVRKGREWNHDGLLQTLQNDGPAFRSDFL